MGCQSSREKKSLKKPSSSHSPSLPPESTPLMSANDTMGHPSTPMSASHLSSQHERLILERKSTPPTFPPYLLPFKDASQFQEWLQGPFIRGSWTEFCRDFLARHPTAPECDKAKVAKEAKDAINSRSAKYLAYHPEKDGWGPDDHVVRFIVTVVADNMLKSLWSDSDWKKRNIEIAKAVYEVLSFLRASELSRQNPPGYEASLLR